LSSSSSSSLCCCLVHVHVSAPYNSILLKYILNTVILHFLSIYLFHNKLLTEWSNSEAFPIFSFIYLVLDLAIFLHWYYHCHTVNFNWIICHGTIAVTLNTNVISTSVSGHTARILEHAWQWLSLIHFCI
jgi:hypothetical protein